MTLAVGGLMSVNKEERRRMKTILKRRKRRRRNIGSEEGRKILRISL